MVPYISVRFPRCGTDALFLCAQKGPHVRYSMHFSSISFGVFYHECANCFAYFTSFSTAVALPEQCHHKGLETTVEKRMGSVSALCIIFEKQRTGKISRHLSRYLVKLDSTQWSRQLVAAAFVLWFPLKAPKQNNFKRNMYTWYQIYVWDDSFAGVPSPYYKTLRKWEKTQAEWV